MSRLDVGLGKTHVGLLLADRKDRTKIEISLGQYGSTDSLSTAIGRIKRHGRRKSDMGYALEIVQNKVRFFYHVLGTDLCFENGLLQMLQLTIIE